MYVTCYEIVTAGYYRELEGVRLLIIRSVSVFWHSYIELYWLQQHLHVYTSARWSKVIAIWTCVIVSFNFNSVSFSLIYSMSFWLGTETCQNRARTLSWIFMFLSVTNVGVTATFTFYGFQVFSLSRCRWQYYQLFINVSLPTLKIEQKLFTEMKICCMGYAKGISTRGRQSHDFSIHLFSMP